MTVTGLEHLERIEGPVIFAANHQSHFDGPVILDALPPRWRYRTAPAMMQEFFNAHFFPERYTRKEWFTNSLNYYLSSLFFNAFPLTQGGAGTRQTLRYIGELVGDGYSILIFPEGRRTEARRDRPVPARGRDDRGAARRAGGAGPAGRARSAYCPVTPDSRRVARARCAFGTAYHTDR